MGETIHQENGYMSIISSNFPINIKLLYDNIVHSTEKT